MAHPYSGCPGVDPVGNLPLFEKSAKSLGDVSLTRKDLEDFSVACQQIHALMSDGEWHSKEEFRKVTGQDEGPRRMRDLRSFGFIIEVKREHPLKRVWMYRLVGRKTNEATT